MASSGENALDMAYLVAALVEDYGGELIVSESWFTSESNPFVGSRLKLDNKGGSIHITLEEEGN